MMRIRNRRANQRGAAALEFALVLPVLITLLGMMVAIGQGLKARHQMLNYATAAARYCAFQKPSPSMRGSLTGCVNSYVSYITSQDDTSLPPCTNIQVTSSTVPSNANPDMYYLAVQMSCDASWVPVVGPLDGVGVQWPGASYQVLAKSSMPFMLPQTLATTPPVTHL